MSQQRGLKRARKVQARKQKHQRLERKAELKKLIFQTEEISKAIEAAHKHDENCKHDH